MGALKAGFRERDSGFGKNRSCAAYVPNPESRILNPEAMMLITCPHCGPRDATEFHLRRRCERAAAGESGFSDERTMGRIRLQCATTPRGEHSELWQHSFGCRRWITVRRNTYTHDIRATGLPE